MAFDTVILEVNFRSFRALTYTTLVDCSYFIGPYNNLNK